MATKVRLRLHPIQLLQEYKQLKKYKQLTNSVIFFMKNKQPRCTVSCSIFDSRLVLSDITQYFPYLESSSANGAWYAQDWRRWNGKI